jgi:hypothetical protein
MKRVGEHEVYGAIRAAEMGDGTIECDTVENTLQIIDLMIFEDEIFTMFNNNIIKVNKLGIYNGAYRAIELATKGEISLF